MASGLWFHVLPAALVPPLVVAASVVGQLVGLRAVKGAFDWRRCTPFLGGALFGVPLGVAALGVATPDVLRLCVGVFLMAYAVFQLGLAGRLHVGAWGGRGADGAVGVTGGILGGFAGLSGAIPLVWLQLRGGSSRAQRAVYQPFNLIVLALAGIGMGLAGHVTAALIEIAALCLPVTVGGAWLGTRAYGAVSEATFRKVVLFLLLCSGTILILQT